MSLGHRYIVLWMVLVMVLAPVVQADSSCDFSFSNYAHAVQLHDMGDYDKALQHYHCALENDPDNAIIPVLIANVYEDIASASSAWSADVVSAELDVIQVSLTNLQPVSLGKNALPILDDRGAIAVKTPVKSEPASPIPETLRLAAATFAARGEYALALDQYQALLGFEPNNAETHFSIAYAWHALDEPRSALPHLQRTLELRPDHLSAQYFLAINYSQLGRRAEALALTDELFGQYSGDYAWPLVMGHVYRNLGYDAIAGRQFYDWIRQIEQVSTEAEITSETSTLSLSYGQVFRLKFRALGSEEIDISARSHLVNSVALDPVIVVLDPDGVAIVGDDDSGKLFDAELSFRAEQSGEYMLLVSHAGGNSKGEMIVQISGAVTKPYENLREKARQASLLGDYEQAISWTKAAIAREGGSSEDYAYLAYYYQLQGDLAAAAQALVKALQLEPTRNDLRCKLGMVYEAQGEFQAALAEFDDVISRNLSDDCANENRRALTRMINEVASESARTVTVPEATAQDLLDKARQAQSAGKFYTAAHAFRDALQMDASLHHARCELGAIYAKWGNYGSALEAFDRVLHTDPGHECARQQRNAAVRKMMKMIHFLPMTAADFIYHARVYAELEDWTQARGAFVQALELNPRRTDVRCELGMIYVQLGDDRSALNQFDRVLTEHVVDSCAWSNRDALMQRMRDG